MAKYSFEFKQQIVQAYLNGEGGFNYLSKKYGIPDKKPLREWVAAYKEYGVDGLLRSRERKNYSFDFKIHVVELYLTTEISYQELALSVGLNNPSLISRWVNDFRIAGPDALRAKRKGRRRIMEKAKEITPTNSEAANATNEYVNQLEDELLKLKIENAYLKELRRLRLEEEALLKRQRESSTASEETSN